MHPASRSSRNLAAPALGKMLADALGRLSLVALAAILLRNEGLTALGAYSQSRVVASLVVPLASFGLTHAAVPFFAARSWDQRTRGDALRIMGTIVAGACAAGVAVFLLAAPLDRWLLRSPDGPRVFQATGLLIIAMAGEAIVMELLRARSRFSLYVSMEITQAVLAVGIAWFTVGTRGVATFIGVLAAARLFVASGMSIMAIRHDTRGHAPHLQKPIDLRDAARFGFPVSLSDLGAWTVLLWDRLVLGHYENAAILGAYAAVYTAASIVTAVGTAILVPAYPRLVRQWSAYGTDAVGKETARIHALLGPAVLATSGWLVMIAPIGLNLIAGTDLGIPLSVIILVIAGVALNQWNRTVHYYLLSHKRGTAVRTAWGLGALAALIGALILIPPFGVVGAAATTVAAYVVVESRLTFTARRVGHGQSLHALGPSIAATAAVIGATALSTSVLGAIDRTWAAVLAASITYAVVWIVIFKVAEKVTRSVGPRLTSRVDGGTPQG